MDNLTSLEAAFAGAHAIFSVTDFWQFAQDPETHSLASAQGITWNEVCYHREVQQGKNVVDAAAKAASFEGFERLVMSSLCDAKKSSGGKYTWVYHFDGKAHVVQYINETAQSDPRYQALLKRTSYVQIGNYLDNWKKKPIFAPQKVRKKTLHIVKFSDYSSKMMGHIFIVLSLLTPTLSLGILFHLYTLRKIPDFLLKR